MKKQDDEELLSADDDDEEMIIEPATKGKQADQQDLYAELENDDEPRKSPLNRHDNEDEEDEDEDENGEDRLEDDAAKEEAIKQRIAASRLHMRHFLASLTPEQTKRYEAFRRVGFSRPAIKRLMQRVWDQPVHPNAIIVVSGVAKVFVGELVEEARRVSLEMGEATPSGMEPLSPAHLLEAHRRLKARGMIPCSRLCSRRNPLL